VPCGRTRTACPPAGPRALAAEGKAVTTVRTYTDAVRWFAARLIAQDGCIRWEEAGKHDVQESIAGLLE
jgi:hypothetical protein